MCHPRIFSTTEEGSLLLPGLLVQSSPRTGYNTMGETSEPIAAPCVDLEIVLTLTQEISTF